MNRIVYALCIAGILCLSSAAIALDCPKQVEQAKKEWETEGNVAVAKVAKVQGADLKVKTKNASHDLLGKLPNADALYLEQMMYAAVCSALRDEKTISESEKAQRLMIYNAEARKEFAAARRGK
jgi:hypothetical protein